MTCHIKITLNNHTKISSIYSSNISNVILWWTIFYIFYIWETQYIELNWIEFDIYKVGLHNVLLLRVGCICIKLKLQINGHALGRQAHWMNKQITSQLKWKTRVLLWFKGKPNKQTQNLTRLISGSVNARAVFVNGSVCFARCRSIDTHKCCIILALMRWHSFFDGASSSCWNSICTKFVDSLFARIFTVSSSCFVINC